MPDPSKTSRQPLHPLVAVGFVLFLAGCVAALWLSEWRYAVTGLAVLLVVAVVSVIGKRA